MLDLFVCRKHFIMGGEKAVVESFNHSHRQDNKTVLMGLVCTKQGVSHIPDQVCLFFNIDANCLDLIVRVHILLPP